MKYIHYDKSAKTVQIVCQKATTATTNKQKEFIKNINRENKNMYLAKSLFTC